MGGEGRSIMQQGAEGDQASGLANMPDVDSCKGNEPNPKDLDDDDEDDEGGKQKAVRRKINIEFIEDKSRRHITFSKRKSGIMKKAYELSALTGTQVLLLVASETGHVYTYATEKLQPLIQKPEGKNLIQTCLSAPDQTAGAPQAVAAPMAVPQDGDRMAKKQRIEGTAQSVYNVQAQAYGQVQPGRYGGGPPQGMYPGQMGGQYMQGMPQGMPQGGQYMQGMPQGMQQHMMGPMDGYPVALGQPQPIDMQHPDPNGDMPRPQSTITETP